MNNLKPNMYIRTKEGKIDKIVEINTEDFEEPTVRLASYPIGMYQGMFEYKNANYNLLELIEPGDVLEIDNEKYEVIYDESFEKLGILIPSRKELSIRHSALEYVFKKYKVSIVTKEQFKSISYEVY